MVTKAAQLKIWEPYRNENCELCPLHESAQSVCLMGDGPVPSRVMLVGEAPGFREDEIGKPFSGKAGQYLDNILAEVGLPRESVFITNANKCRPPDNRTPTKREIEACSTYLQSEIAAVRPEFVVPLGNVALQATLGVKGIMSKRGALIEKGAIKYLPTLHPAAILRNPAWEQMFKADLQKLARLVAGKEHAPETKVWLIKSSKSLRTFLKKVEAVDGPISFDIESWGPGYSASGKDAKKGGLHLWNPKWIILTCSFTWEVGVSYVVALEHPQASWDIPIESVYSALNVALEGKQMIGHNVKFDMSGKYRKGVKLHAKFDTLLAAHLLDENRPNGLKPLARTLLGADAYEENIDFKKPHPLGPLAVYNGKDTDYTLRLYHLFRVQLKERPRLLRLFKLLVMPACNSFVEIESNGFPVDMRRLRKRNEDILEKIEGIRQQMLEYVPEEMQPGANFRSPIFLAKFFFGVLELPILEVTPKSGKPSTREAVLKRLRRKHPAVNLLMELRKWMKYESTYTRNWMARTAAAGKPRVYTAYNLSGTVTGRLSSNMQQVPREILIRSIIGFSPETNAKLISQGKPARRFVEADFSQIELRIAAMLSRDPRLTKAFLTGEDPHMETAVAVTGKDASVITKEERKLAKSVNFGFLYGMGAKKFRAYAYEKFDLNVSLEDAQEYRKQFFRQYRALPAWHDRQRRIVRNLQFVTSPIGRIRHLPAIASDDDYLSGQAEREAINAPVQGFASDLTVLSMVLLHDRLDRKRARIIGNVHDSVLFEIDDDYIDTSTKIIRETMENLPLKRYFGYQPTIPIHVDILVGDHWGEGK